MTDPRTEQALNDLDAAAKRYRQADEALEAARKAAIEKVVAALNAGAMPTEVVRVGPFTDAYVRRLAREAGVPPSRPGPKKSTKPSRRPAAR